MKGFGRNHNKTQGKRGNRGVKGVRGTDQSRWGIWREDRRRDEAMVKWTYHFTVERRTDGTENSGGVGWQRWNKRVWEYRSVQRSWGATWRRTTKDPKVLVRVEREEEWGWKQKVVEVGGSSRELCGVREMSTTETSRRRRPRRQRVGEGDGVHTDGDVCR